jgi:hypothetical protein
VIFTFVFPPVALLAMGRKSITNTNTKSEQKASPADKLLLRIQNNNSY